MIHQIDGYLVSPEWLEQRLGKDVVVVDCRKVGSYRQSHIQGAVCLPIDYWLKENNDAGIARGTHLIDQATFTTIIAKMGIRHDTTVVAYDDESRGRAAARLWWVLAYYGHKDVKVLNGGWSLWLAKNRSVSKDIPEPTPQKYVVDIQPHIKIDLDELLANLGHFQIIDVRSLDEWSGRDAHGNPRAGRIPNAVHLEWLNFITDDTTGCLKEAKELIRIISTVNLDPAKPTVTYCQAGIRASYVAFVLTLLGFKDVRVFDGSMQEWSRHADTPMIK